MKISYDDERNLYRLLDGEMPPAEAAALQARMEAEPTLRAEFEEHQRMRSTLASAAAARTFSAPAGFTASVLGAARRLPDRRELQELEVGGSIVRVCRQILIAAAVVVGLGALWHLGLFRGGHDSRLEAGPNEVQKEMERLDSLIDADEAGVTRAK